MTPLETAIREAVKSGLAGLTLYPTQDGRWQASVTQDRIGWRVDADPITALQRACGEKPAPAGDIFA